MKKILSILLLLISFQLNAQVSTLYGNNKLYIWNAVTGSNLITDTDVFLYGSFTKTKVPKDSLDNFGNGSVRAGTTSASKYIGIYKSFSSYTSDWSADADGWLLDPETPITTYNVDGVWGVDDCAYVPTNMSIIDTLFYENLPFEGFIRIQFDYYYGMFGTTILIRGIGNEAFNHNIQPESYMSWNHFDSTFAVSSNIYGVDAISGLGITSSGDSLYLKDFSYDFYYGDSTRTLAKSVSLSSLVEDETYTYYTSVLQPNGRYSKGDDSTFTTPLRAPLLLEITADTGKAYLEWYDDSDNETYTFIERKISTNPVDSFIVIDSVLANVTTYLDSPLVNRGVYTWRLRNKHTNYSAYSDTASSLVEEWIPILEFSPSIADFGLKYWADSSFSYTDTTEVTVADDYDYTTIASRDTIQVLDPITYPDSVHFTTIVDIDTTAGSSGSKVLPIIESYTEANNENNSFTTLTFTRPADIANGNLQLIIMVSENDSSGTTPQYSISGWTNLDESGTNTEAARIGVLYKVSNGTENATETLNIDMTSVQSLGWWLNISNVNTSDVFNAFNFTQSGGNLTAHIIPSITTDGDSCLAIAGLSFDGADATFSQGITWTLGDTAWTTFGSTVESSGIWGYKYQLSAGATGNDTITTSQSDGSAYFQLAINPLVGEGTPTTYDTTYAYWYIDTTYAYWDIVDHYASGGGTDTIEITVYNNNTVPIDVDSIYISGDDTPFTYDAFAETIGAKDSSSFNIYASIDTVGAWNKFLVVVGEYTDQDIGLTLTSISLDSIPPDIPTDILLTGANRSANLTWTNGAESGNKYILWALNSETDLVIGDSVGSEVTSYSITGLDSGSVYRAGLIAYDANHNLTDTSATDTALVIGNQVIDTTPPTGLTGITAVGNSDGTITITATQGGTLSDVYSYTIMRSTENPSFTTLSQIAHPRPSYDSVLATTNLSGTTFSYTDNSVNRGSVYSYKVGNWDASGNGNWWSTVNDTATVPLADTTSGEIEGSGYFVGLTATGLGDGSNWDNMNVYTAIPFASLPDYTTVYFDGGVTSVTYPSQLSIPNSADNIAITKGTSAGHNGEVIIASPTQTGSAILLNGVLENFAITNITVTGGNRAIYMQGGFDSLKIENCRITDYAEFGFSTNGSPDTSTARMNLWVINNHFEMSEAGNPNYIQTDGLSVQSVRNFFFIGNTVINRNLDADDTHNDLIQAQYNTNQYYINNFFYTDNARDAGQNGIQLGGNSAGDFYLVNNVIMMGQYSYQSAIWAELFARHWGNMRVVNNTFIGANPRFNYLGAYPNAVYKNNLFWSYPIRDMFRTRPFFYIETGDGSGADLTVENNNFYYQSSQYFMQATGAFTLPVSNGWYLGTTYTPTLAGFTYSPTSYTTCPYSENYADYLLTSSSTREWGQGETLEEADFPTNAQAPSWFKAWDYVNKYSNGTIRTQWDIGAR